MSDNIRELISKEQDSLTNIITAVGEHIRLHMMIGKELKGSTLDDTTRDYKASVTLYDYLEENPNALDDLNNIVKVYRLIGLVPPLKRRNKI